MTVLASWRRLRVVRSDSFYQRWDRYVTPIQTNKQMQAHLHTCKHACTHPDRGTTLHNKPEVPVAVAACFVRRPPEVRTRKGTRAFCCACVRDFTRPLGDCCVSWTSRPPLLLSSSFYLSPLCRSTVPQMQAVSPVRSSLRLPLGSARFECFSRKCFVQWRARHATLKTFCVEPPHHMRGCRTWERH